MNIMERIDELCKQRNISKYRLSQITGISQSAFSKMARQQSSLSLETIQRICDALGISLAQFFSESKKYPDLTLSQIQLLDSWSLLDEKKRAYALLMIKNLIDL
ncbi:MAG: helix-turn-helix transcriptional regulator [Lachnospiraceae bacterium]|jgi:transcriptional regulator with XRE-family HTH domain|nr:helix-turn-helix transcriptional regulator [Lachnospiraceae bacterium]MCI9283474.1 helix-turn-helix transcriptional regulator [Lachnospiraceae bacterium]